MRTILKMALVGAALNGLALPEAVAQRPSAATDGQRPATAVPATQRLSVPIRIFDDLYYVGTDYVSAYIVETSDGLVLIDSLYQGFTREMIEGLDSIGLDPREIRYVLVSHGHTDHFGGALEIQELSGARVGATAADWELIEASGSVLTRDMVLADGDTLTVGATEFRFHVTPGHTPGVLSIEYPVHDGDQTHKAFHFGGHNVTTNQPEAFEQFIASVERLQATLSDVDVNLTSHPWASLIFQRAQILAERAPGAPHPFVWPEDFEAFLDERLSSTRERLARARAGLPD